MPVLMEFIDEMGIVKFNKTSDPYKIINMLF